MQTAGISGATAAQSLGGQRGLGSMKSEDFFRILVTELQQQDPFEPAKTSDMVGQVAQIRDIELSGTLTGTLDTLAQQQRAAGTGDLIGKYIIARVAGEGGSDAQIEGVVTGVSFDADASALLELDTGSSVPMASVQRVTTLEQAIAEQSALLAGATAQSGADASAAAKPIAKPSEGEKPWWLNWLNLDAAIRV